MSMMQRMVVLAVFVLVTGGCGSGTGGDETTAETSPTTVVATTTTTTTTDPPTTTTSASPTTAAPTTAATPVEPEPEIEVVDPADVDDLFQGNGPVPIATGTYRSPLFGDDVGLRVDGPALLRFHSPDFLAVGRPEWTREDLAGIYFAALVGVMPAAEVGVHQAHDPVIPISTLSAPDDLVGWLSTIDQINVLDSGESMVLGEPAIWVEFEIDGADGPTFECPVGPQCLGLLVNPEGVVAFTTGERYRLHQLEALKGVAAWERADGQTSSAVRGLMDELQNGLVRTAAS